MRNFLRPRIFLGLNILKRLKKNLVTLADFEQIINNDFIQLEAE